MERVRKRMLILVIDVRALGRNKCPFLKHGQSLCHAMLFHRPCEERKEDLWFRKTANKPPSLRVPCLPAHLQACNQRLSSHSSPDLRRHPLFGTRAPIHPPPRSPRSCPVDVEIKPPARRYALTFAKTLCQCRSTRCSPRRVAERGRVPLPRIDACCRRCRSCRCRGRRPAWANPPSRRPLRTRRSGVSS